MITHCMYCDVPLTPLTVRTGPDGGPVCSDDCGYNFMWRDAFPSDDPGYPPEEYEDGMTDVEADADTLRSAGWGTDEDYNYYGGEKDY